MMRSLTGEVVVKKSQVAIGGNDILRRHVG